MNIKFKVIGIIVLIVFNILQVKGQRAKLLYKNQIAISINQLKRQGDSLAVDLRLDMAVLSLSPRRTLTLTPTLRSGSGEILELPDVVIKGTNQYKAYKREMALMSEKERKLRNAFTYAVLKSGESRWNFRYRYAVPYQEWMAGSVLEIKEDLCNCDGHQQELAFEEVSVIESIPVYKIQPHIAYAKPQVEAVKKRDAENDCYLDFETSKTYIREDYGKNLKELAKIQNMIDNVKNNKNVIITSLSIIGLAAPEGDLATNKRLSEDRAQSLVSYLSRQYDFPDTIYHVAFGGENWEGLIKYVDKSDMDYKYEVMSILNNQDSYEKKKSRLQRLAGGIPYQFLLREVYPGLRKANCKIEYKVKGFSLEQAREIIKSQPQLLSLNEMYQVADTYEKGSPEYAEVQSTIAQFYPEDETFLLNEAADKLQNNKLAEAENLLKEAKHKSPEYNNSMGVLRMLEGYYDLAEKYFEAAAADGVKEATLNLEEIKKKKENLSLIK